MKLTAQAVNDIFNRCLFHDGENTSEHIVGDGIMTTVGFHPIRLAEAKDEVEDLLGELSDDFYKTKGGGMSFLNMCNDKHGNQWTGMHQTMDQLVSLGLALDAVEYMTPRNLWPSFPGEMPYIVINR